MSVKQTLRSARRASRWRLARRSLVLALALSIPADAAAAATSSGSLPTLRSPTNELRWIGDFREAYSPAPEACRPDPCHEFFFDVRLPSGVWVRPGGVQVAIAWEDSDFDLDLHVYGPDGDVVASSTSVHFAEGQAVRIDAAENGSYRARVVPNSISPFASIRDVSFRGIVGVRYQARKQPARDLLPDLVALPPANLHLQTGTAIPGNPYISTQHGIPGNPESCYPQEADPAAPPPGERRCLRFDQGVGNVGEGQLEIRQRNDQLAAGQLSQRIYSSGGGHRDLALPDAAEFHPAHGHFHYPDFARSRLYELRADGGRGALVREGKKNGFCLTDVRNLWFDQGGGEPRTYAFPGTCDFPADEETFLVAGISPGWADVYDWYLQDQFIDVTGLPEGDYVLELDMNVARAVVEADTGNNRASTRLHLAADSVRET